MAKFLWLVSLTASPWCKICTVVQRHPMHGAGSDSHVLLCLFPHLIPNRSLQFQWILSWQFEQMLLRYLSSLSPFNAYSQCIIPLFCIPTKANSEAQIWVKVDYWGDDLKKLQWESETGKERNTEESTVKEVSTVGSWHLKPRRSSGKWYRMHTSEILPCLLMGGRRVISLLDLKEDPGALITKHCMDCWKESPRNQGTGQQRLYQVKFRACTKMLRAMGNERRNEMSTIFIFKTYPLGDVRIGC